MEPNGRLSIITKFVFSNQMNYRKCFPVSLTCAFSRRFIESSTDRSKGHLKNIVKPEVIPVEYWKRILWVAADLKQAVKESGKKSLKLLETNHVTLLFAKPQGRFQLSYTLACDLLGARRTLYRDPNFENQYYPGDSGRALSSLTDMFVLHGLHHDVLIKLVSKATVPVFSASCNIHCMQKALSDLMTYQEKLNRLKGLEIAWIGPPSSVLNSYLILCAKFGINVRYNCICKFGAGGMSPVNRYPNDELESGDQKENKFTEYQTPEETVKGAHIVVTSMHSQEKHKVTLELLKTADPNCVFMHSLPRSSREVSDEVFSLENNLSWKTSENYLYVAMAIVLTSLQEFKPKRDMPDFDGATI